LFNPNTTFFQGKQDSLNLPFLKELWHIYPENEIDLIKVSTIIVYTTIYPFEMKALEKPPFTTKTK
jgi:hypothetical protein